MSDNRKFVQGIPYQLSGGGVIVGDTTVTIKNFVDAFGNDLALSDFGTKGYATVQPNVLGYEEPITFTGVTNNGDGTWTLTGVSSQLAKAPYTETSGFLRPHAGATTLIITNTAGFYDTFANKNDDETISGIWSFTAVPNSTAAPVAGDDLANKTYVDAVAGGSATTDQVIEAGTAGETVSAGQLVYYDDTDNEWKLCDADTLATVNDVPLGIAQGAGTNGNPITNGVLILGVDTNQSGLTGGTLYYASNTAGGISSSPGTNPVKLGFAKSATELYFNPQSFENYGLNRVWTGTAEFDAAVNFDAAVDFDGTVDMTGSSAVTVPTPDADTEATNRVFVDAGQTVEELTSGAAFSVRDALYVQSSDGRVLAADSDAAESSLGFIGFALEAATGAAESKRVATQGIVSGFAGLTPGAKYYTQSSAGTIGTTPGTFSMQVGIALSATQILIAPGQLYGAGVVSDLVTTSAANNDVTVTLGFKPRFIKLHYFIQGYETGNTEYLAEKGIAIFGGTTLLTKNLFWLTPNVAGDGLTADNGTPADPTAAMTNIPNSTSALVAGATGGANDSEVTVTINSVSATGFVIRRVTVVGGAPNNARAKIAYEAWA